MHLVLFAVTAVTTTLAGMQPRETLLASVLSGLPFSMTIMAILLSHEMGHYLAARRFGVKATLPYFIPFPSIIGTMGAVIKIKSPIRDRRALLYIGAMGPLVGFVLSLAATIAGMYLSEIKPLPAPGTGDIPIFGDSLLFRALGLAIHGAIPPGHDIYLSSYAWAGWIGFLVTSLNLMPMGQLDGSHILYALIGRRQLIIGWATFAGLVALSFVWPGWVIWVAMALLFLMIGHPPVPDSAPLAPAEKLLGWCCIAIFFLTFIPVPVEFL
ncbi:MAG TPA: site-2 protease family protein [Spirochaetes bacterium]|nr:site-2 protease family protein [Spirochaetota bacterium]